MVHARQRAGALTAIYQMLGCEGSSAVQRHSRTDALVGILTTCGQSEERRLAKGRVVGEVDEDLGSWASVPDSIAPKRALLAEGSIYSSNGEVSNAPPRK